MTSHMAKKPKVVVFENVRGLLSIKDEDGSLFQKLLICLAGLQTALLQSSRYCHLT